jgi:serine/threonine-protein kinase
MAGLVAPLPRTVGRYQLFYPVGVGGMATVHVGRLVGPEGFTRTVAIKRLHEYLASDRTFGAMLMDEARLAARIRHRNVVSTLDVVRDGDELFIVMDYVDGESLAHMLRAAQERRTPVPIDVAVAVTTGVLQGLHAAHDATDDDGKPLCIVHRDVSPQNILVTTDGVPLVADFGVAKAAGRSQSTYDGRAKGKAGYMAPEQLSSGEVDRRTDVYAAAVVLWELLTGSRLFMGNSPAETVLMVLESPVRAPSQLRSDVPRELDAVVLRGLARQPHDRFASALQMAVALERALRPATTREVAEWVRSSAGEAIQARARKLAQIGSAPGLSGALAQSEIVSHEIVSDLSSVSVSTPRLAVRRLPPRRALAVALLVAGALALIGILQVRARAHGKSSDAQAPPPTSTPPPSPSADPEPMATSETSSPPKPVASTPDVPRLGSARRPQRASPARLPSCKPPYRIGATGLHIPKPECL